MKIITVHTTGSRETCMKVVCHTFHLRHRNVARQQLVQLIGQLRAVNLCREIEMSHHHAGMYASIRPPCSCHNYFLTEQKGKSPLQLCLHGVPVGLYLPPMIAAPIVTECNKISHFGWKATLPVTLPSERQVVGTSFFGRFLCRREWSGGLRSSGRCGLLRRERSSTNGSGISNGSAGNGCCNTVEHVESTDIIEPAAIKLMGINIKLYGQILTILNVELTDAILSKDAEYATLRILSWNFDYIILRHPRIARAGRGATLCW